MKMRHVTIHTAKLEESVKFYEEIAGGVIEDPDLGPLEARDQILEDQGWQDCDLKEVDTEELEENVEGAN